jgi:UDP-N-acetyl-D-galactosamine dehydrogenase
MTQNMSIGIIGLGYVGLPLAVALSKYFNVKGFDISSKRIQELHDAYDRTHEIHEDVLRSMSLKVSDDIAHLKECQVYIVTVPTPINDDHSPDLSPLELASRMIGGILKKGDIVVYESTVYPGVTEDVCGVILQDTSKLQCGVDFMLGYSPERINPGDQVHTVDKITKVVAGQTQEVTNLLAHIYGKMNNDRIFKAASIKVAEASKVIENTQRDINIAFINEITHIFSKMSISVYDVLEASGTKWNFLKFYPGLVGGHCIGVDPYYLAKYAENLGVEPKVILSGRQTNESVAKHYANFIKNTIQGPRILILGLTFKENIPDLRNTKIIDLKNHLIQLGCHVDIHDGHCDPFEAKAFYNLDILTYFHQIELSSYDSIVAAVSHRGYLDISADFIESLLNPNGVIFDLKNMWSHLDFNKKYIKL